MSVEKRRNREVDSQSVHHHTLGYSYTYRTIVSLNVRRCTKLSQNVLRENLSELNTHLVERVDTPNNTLGEDLVFGECDQSTKSGGSQLWEDDAVRGFVAREDFGFDERFRGVRAKLLQEY